MSYWAFDDYYLDTEASVIALMSGRKVWINVDDHIVFFHREYSDLVFNSSASVKNVALEDMGESGYKFIAKIRNIESFEENRYLGDFSYSLERIYRYKNPLLHFRRPYIRFTENDFRTINEARIYWARTAFGHFMNHLPQEHIVRFMRKLSESAPAVLLQQSDYKRAWKALHKFIEEEYVSAANLFKVIKGQVERANDIFDIGLNYSTLGFSTDDENEPPDFIQKQERLFSKFTDLLYFEEAQLDLLHEIDKRVEEAESIDETFDEIFRGTAWPIQMIES